MNCDQARIYTGAVADGELDVIPPAVLHHIEECHDCAAEVRWQREAQAAIAGALAAEDAWEPPPPGRLATTRSRSFPRLAFPALAAAVLIVAALVGLATRAGAGSPEIAMSDAAHAYGHDASFRSTDTVAISAWAAGQGMAVRGITVPGKVATGARLSRVVAHNVVTIIYAGSAGITEVTVIPASMTTGWPLMEETRVEANPVGLVHHAGATFIVVSADDASLHEAMVALQS